MYRIEIITPDELLAYGENFNDFYSMIARYKNITHYLNTCNHYKGDTIQVFAGVDYENMNELLKYRKDL